jgi:uncharacterized repeat protein (TIGR03803 family)
MRGPYKNGTLFRITPEGSFSVIHAFDVPGPGPILVSGLSEGPDHALYGTIGAFKFKGGGFVFRVTMAGEFTALHEFGDSAHDPRGPEGPPVAGPDGNFYGVTSLGGEEDLGAVYRMTPQGEFTVIHFFSGSDLVYRPNLGVTISSDGRIYGTTSYGADSGVGGVYRMDLDGGNFTVIHAWPKTGKDGAILSSFLLAPDGVIYGSTEGFQSGPNGDYDGLVFKIDAAGVYSIVHGFRSEGAAGIQPCGSLALDAEGALYGATLQGGPNDAGSVFRIAANGEFQVLARLGEGPTAPRYPRGGVALAPDGSVWLTTHRGGRHDGGEWGTIVRVPPRVVN